MRIVLTCYCSISVDSTEDAVGTNSAQVEIAQSSQSSETSPVSGSD